MTNKIDGRGQHPNSIATRIKKDDVGRHRPGRPKGSKGVAGEMRKALMNKFSWEQNGKMKHGTVPEATASGGIQYSMKGKHQYFKEVMEMAYYIATLDQANAARAYDKDTVDMLRVYHLHYHRIFELSDDEIDELIDLVKLKRLKPMRSLSEIAEEYFKRKAANRTSS